MSIVVLIDHLSVFWGIYGVIIFYSIWYDKFSLQPQWTSLDESVLILHLCLQFMLSLFSLCYQFMQLIVLVVQWVIFQTQRSNGDIFESIQSLKISLKLFYTLLKLLLLAKVLGVFIAEGFDSFNTRRWSVVMQLNSLLLVQNFQAEIQFFYFLLMRLQLLLLSLHGFFK